MTTPYVFTAKRGQRGRGVAVVKTKNVDEWAKDEYSLLSTLRWTLHRIDFAGGSVRYFMLLRSRVAPCG